MEEISTSVVAKPTPPKHWPIYFWLMLPAFLLNSGTNGNWAMAFGYVAVPAVIGYFIIRGGTDFKSLIPRYLIFVALLYGLVFVDATNRLAKVEKNISTSCIERNAEVAKLESEEDKKTFCGCYGKKMAKHVMWSAGSAFLTLREPLPIQNDSKLMSIATDAFSQCAVLISPS